MTKLRTWISARRGRASSLALHLNVSRGRITQIADHGVPAKHMLAIRDFTAGEVTLEDLVATRTANSSKCNSVAPDKADHA